MAGGSSRYSVLFFVLTGVVSYHFDNDNIILYENSLDSSESRASYFGFSTALGKPGKSSTTNSWLFIGSPRANSSVYPGVNEPGTVFKCEIGKPCREWILQAKDSKEAPTSGSWLGGAMNIENKLNPQLVVCGHRWMEYGRINTRKWLMRGMCYEAGAGQDSVAGRAVGMAMTPLQDTQIVSKENLSNFAFGESGFSIHIIPNSYDLEYILGCPEVWVGHGIPIIHSARFGRKKPFLVPDPSQDSSVDSSDYSGYAVTSGNYFRPKTRRYVSGVPRSEGLLGKIIVFDFPQEEMGPITVYNQLTKGDQVGGYFGAALASCDIDNDGLDNLIVGAPLWTKNLDEGRIYVYKGQDKDNFVLLQHFEGETKYGRFGSTITCLGDIDHNGYADIAVGAPYSGKGVVYIFHGGKDGLRRSQKIPGSEGTNGFGISISEPRDIDNNGYADIAIGAHLSGHVTLVRSKRIVSLNVDVHTDLPGVTLERSRAKPFVLFICSSYTGTDLPERLDVITELRIDEGHRRARLSMPGIQGIYKFPTTLNIGRTTCENFTIILESNIADFLNPLRVSVTQRLSTSNYSKTLIVTRNATIGKDNFNKSSAVLSGSLSEVRNGLTIPFEQMCGSDNICHSNLTVYMSTNLGSNNFHVIGSTSYISLVVGVLNTGEDAYGTRVVIYIPDYIRLRRMPNTCTKKETNELNAVTCEIDNPLAAGVMKNVSIDLDMSGFESDHFRRIELEAIAKTQSMNKEHKTHLLIESVIEADFGITGKADVDRYSYALQGKDDEPLPKLLFQHSFEIKNHEVSPITEALLSLSIPTHWIHRGREIEIVRLNKTTRQLDGTDFDCYEQNADEIHSTSRLDATTMPEWLTNNRNASQTEKKFTVIEGKVFAASPDNRTLYINTTNPSVKWSTINCLMGRFINTQSVAKVTLELELLLENFIPEIIEDNDIIFVVTNGSTRVTMPSNFIQTANNAPDCVMTGTMFVGSRLERQVAPWVIGTSVGVGILLLILIVFALFKFGFFKRSKKMELQALKKSEQNMEPKILLETNSSRETLDLS